MITMEKAAREADIFKKKLMARIDSLESDRRFLYEQERSLTKKVQDLEEGSIEFKVGTHADIALQSTYANGHCLTVLLRMILDDL